MGFHSVNTSNAATCCAANSSTGTVIDHVVVSPSLCPALLSSEVLSEAPFPTHKPVAADLAIDALRDTWHVLRLPRPFPVGSLVAVDGEPLQMHSRLSGVQAILAAGDPERAYEIWTALAELARLCRRGGLASHLFTLVALSFRHLSLVLSRVSVFVVISISKDWKKHVPGWLNCVPNGRQAFGLALNNTQQKTWFHACRRLALVDDVWLPLPEEAPSLCEVQNLLGSVRAYIDSRNQRVRYHDLQTWRHRMLASQADRLPLGPGQVCPLAVC